MKVLAILLLSCFSLSISAQPFDTAPKTKKKVRRIIEWVRPNLQTSSDQGMISTFDRMGRLTSYTTQDDSSIFNTYRLFDQKNRIKEIREGKGSNLRITRYIYRPNQMVEEMTFHGKMERSTSYYNKQKKIIEKKSYAKGLELGERFRLKERILFQYNKKGQLVGEKIMTYDLPHAQQFNTRKKIHYYHPEHRQLIKTIVYDYDGTVSRIEDYAYYPDQKLKLVISNYPKDELVSTKEFLYKAGKIWQRIASERGTRHVEVFTDGRLIRLRSYHQDQLYRVVDYQYEYY